MICCNTNHYNYTKEVYQILMVDYLLVLTLDEDYSSDPSNIYIYIYIYITVDSPMASSGSILSVMSEAHHVVYSQVKEQRVFWEKNNVQHPDYQDSTKNGNHMPKVKHTHC